MRRSGFTMIELIFVIVILGILAAVALPRFAGVQDDAFVASENAGISSARSGLTALRGRALVRNDNMEITVTKLNGDQAKVAIKKYDRSAGFQADSFSSTSFPNSLSVNSGFTAPTQTAEGEDYTLAMVLEPGSRSQWNTRADSNNTVISGPASSKVIDESAELNTKGSWLYNPTSGTITYRDSTPY